MSHADIEHSGPSQEDETPLSELSDEELEIEATDLRSDMESITLDLLDDARGDFYRGDQWRIRARAALAYKRADLNVCNLLIRQRQGEAIVKPASRAKPDKEKTRELNMLEAQQIREHKRAVIELRLEEGRLVMQLAKANQDGKTERHRISESLKKGHLYKVVCAYKSRFGKDVYLDVLRSIGVPVAEDRRPDDPATLEANPKTT